MAPSPIELLDLTGKAAIVTGAAMGIGRGIAERLAQAGAGVLVADVDLDDAEETASALRDAGANAVAQRADVARVADAEAAVAAAVDAFGRLDILVNNAGIFPMRPALDVDEALWDRVLSINLKGTFFWSQATARHMVGAGHGGAIVNVASIDALHPSGNLVHYDASKGGVAMMTRSLALEWGRHGIRVNAVAPGGIDTPGARALSAPDPAAPPPDMSAFTARIPLGRMGVSDDIARAVLFCATEMSAYMTGSLIVVDGGYLLT